jgi:hypothetical protein
MKLQEASSTKSGTLHMSDLIINIKANGEMANSTTNISLRNGIE